MSAAPATPAVSTRKPFGAVPSASRRVPIPSGSGMAATKAPKAAGGRAQTSVSINQFNNAYFDCDMINSSAIAAFPTYGSNNLLTQPNVFIGEQGTSYGPCLGLSSSTQYGNNVTAYTVVGE